MRSPLQIIEGGIATPEERLQRAGQRFSAEERRLFEAALTATMQSGQGDLEHVAGLIELLALLDLDHECATATLLVPLLRESLIDATILRQRFGSRVEIGRASCRERV